MAHPDHGGVRKIRARGEVLRADFRRFQMVEVGKTCIPEVVRQAVRVKAGYPGFAMPCNERSAPIR